MRTAVRVIGMLGLAGVVCASIWGASPARPARAAIQSVTATACPGHLSVSVFFDDVGDRRPQVAYMIGSAGYDLTFLDSFEQTDADSRKTRGWAWYARDDQLRAGVKGQVVVNGGKAAEFEVSRECPVLGRIAGSAYIDANANGRRDRGEPGFPSAWLKLTDGGSWFVCGWAGGDSTFGITVLPGVYYLLPVAPAGYRTTTPRVKALMRAYGDVLLGNDIGFVKDAAAQGESCDQYNPPRP